ncbi:M23 family peptidase [Bradyrhizobium sp. U87765 SZCCT0131]|nr:M23 family peptidase [Bradyrhizobium sp. U87765 SZCCT0131]MBR1263221.1 M23 family peptidase [Bradyrhizobium sp. U87765 SZCCT0134]MBR1323395.1 M23 family peptidase [Bradyrhizobium sp. U87765 SZCCT0109]
MTGGSTRARSAAAPGAMSGIKRIAFAVALTFAISLLGSMSRAMADTFRTPAISSLQAEWRGAYDQLRAEFNSRPEASGALTFSLSSRHATSDLRHWPALAQLNGMTAPFFPGISRSAVPVLLPFDAADYAGDRVGGLPASLLPSHYQNGFQAEMFDAGPAGYDAVFSLAPSAAGEMAERTYARPVEIHITGSALVYRIDDPLAGKGEPVKALAGQYPDLRRTIREGYLRYAFTRFGIPYVVSILCLDSVPRRNRLACREAAIVAERFLKALRIDGGRPQPRRGDVESALAARPIPLSPDFTYRPVGDIIANSGAHGQTGRADPTVYSQIRFPLKDTPAFANSQSFLNWGDCNFTGRTSTPHAKGGAYRCKRNDKPLVFDESAKENYSYPWQDNFCESRSFEVGQCASGYGHQGQDIRPSDCPLRNDGADRCESNRFAVVAGRDGVILRGRGQQAAFVLANTARDHVRLRYMHMNPTRMDADGLLNGRRVSEGETIGLVSNYQDYPGGTTSHLHFDLQVFTRDGWLWVNPYITLVSAYERLLGARGTEVPAEPVAAPAMVHAPDEPQRPGASSEGAGE